MQKRWLSFEKNYKTTTSAHIVSNEIDHFTMKISRSNGELGVGFGSTKIYDIAGLRHLKKVIIADLSLETLKAHKQLYRPLFLLSESPGEFIWNLAGRDGPAPDSIKNVFKHKLFLEAPSLARIATLKEKGQSFVTQGHLSSDDLNFCLEVISHRPTATKNYPFKKISLDFPLPEMWAYLYDPVRISTITKMPRFLLSLKHFSFLGSSSSYSHIRQLCLENNILYACADFCDREFYQFLNQLLISEKMNLTDLYISNIPSLLANDGKANPLNENLKEIIGEFRRKLWIYEVVGMKIPFLHSRRREFLNRRPWWRRYF